MKKIKLNSKLSIKKEQIASLNNVKGGGDLEARSTVLPRACPTVAETCICPVTETAMEPFGDCCE